MSRTRKHNDKYRKDKDAGARRGERRLSARGVRRSDPDLGRMGKALVAFALAEAEADAADRRAASSRNTPTTDGEESPA